MLLQKKDYEFPNDSTIGYQEDFQKVSEFIENIVFTESHQKQFSKNIDLIKAKYSHHLNPNLTKESLRIHHQFEIFK